MLVRQPSPFNRKTISRELKAIYVKRLSKFRNLDPVELLSQKDKIFDEIAKREVPHAVNEYFKYLPADEVFEIIKTSVIQYAPRSEKPIPCKKPKNKNLNSTTEIQLILNNSANLNRLLAKDIRKKCSDWLAKECSGIKDIAEIEKIKLQLISHFEKAMITFEIPIARFSEILDMFKRNRAQYLVFCETAIDKIKSYKHNIKHPKPLTTYSVGNFTHSIPTNPVNTLHSALPIQAPQTNENDMVSSILAMMHPQLPISTSSCTTFSQPTSLPNSQVIEEIEQLLFTETIEEIECLKRNF